jgi:hypothetical protein
MKLSTEMDRVTAPEKKGSQHNPQHDGWLIRGFIPNFSPRGNHWSCGGKATLCWWQATKLTRPIYRHAIGTFNTCSQGTTHRSLTNTGGGYNLRGVGYPHTTPWPSQPTVSTFHLRAPPNLQINQFHQLIPKFQIKKLRLPRGLSTTRPSTMAYMYT